jgi:lysophospholipase
MGFNYLILLALILPILSKGLSSSSRALPNAPNGYAPAALDCPVEVPAIRDAQNLSSHESTWLEKRQNKRLDAMRDMISRIGIENLNVDSFFEKTEADLLPNIAISFSGGGYRALLNGAGAFAAFDARSPNATALGQLGGLLQSATYVSGLSGGSWLVGSIYMNNATTVSELLSEDTGSVWEFSDSILSGPPNADQYYRQLINDVNSKSDAGFQTSLTDYW